MFGKNIRTATVDTAVLEAEAAARRKREHDDLTASVRRRQAAFDADRNAAEQGRRQRELDAGRADLEKRQRNAEGLGAAQWAWANRRNALRDEVAELQRAIQGAESRMDSAPMPEATAAAAEGQVLERRLKTAELAFAAHMKSSPL
jgi:hypothetical protein